MLELRQQHEAIGKQAHERENYKKKKRRGKVGQRSHFSLSYSFTSIASFFHTHIAGPTFYEMLRALEMAETRHEEDTA